MRNKDWPYEPRVSILCLLFGHKSLEDTHDGGEYMRVRPGAVDGIGRVHCDLIARCPRCDTSYRAGRIHTKENGEVY